MAGSQFSKPLPFLPLLLLFRSLLVAESSIQVTVEDPNQIMGDLSSSLAVSSLWASHNLSKYLVNGRVETRYIASADECIEIFQGQYLSFVVPPMLNLRKSPAKVNLAVDLLVGGSNLLAGITDTSCSCMACGIFCGLWVTIMWVLIYLRILGSL